MSAAEVLYRGRQAVRAFGERTRLALGPDWPSDQALWRGLNGHGSAAWDQYAQGAAARLRAIGTEGRCADDFRQRFPEEEAALVDRAEQASRGLVQVFGRLVELGSPPAWHDDPLTGRRWSPRAFYGRIDLRSGGVKAIWEPARHQHLVTLAQAVWLGANPAHAAALEAGLRSWCEQQRWRRGVHWCSGLEMSVRLASWFWIAALAGDRLSAHLWRDWTRLVVQYGAHLERHLSRYSSANNHLIGEAAGLVLAAEFAPAWRDAPRWRSLGRSVLASEIERQVLPDGTPAEQAFHYLGFVLDFYFLVLRFSPDLANVGSVRDRLGAAATFISTVANDALELPAVGDEDGGAALVVSSRGTSWRSRLALAAVWTNRSELKARAGALDPAAWWLMSDDRLTAWTDLPSVPASLGSRQFAEGGYAVLRAGGTGEALVLFDCGPLGYLSIAAHGHADCLSICASIDGRWCLVDPGTFVYHEAPQWRAHFRGTGAHNTLSIAGHDQSIQAGHTMWGQRAKARWIAWECAPGFHWVEGEHDGYMRVRRRCRHRRAVGLADARYVVVIDWLSAPVAQGLWHYQCAEGMSAHRHADRVTALDAGFSRLEWCVLFDGDIRVVEGRERPPAGWVSPGFGRRVAAPLIEVESAVDAGVPYVTVIGLGGTRLTPRLESIAAEWRITVSHDRGVDTIDVRSPAAAGPSASTISRVRCRTFPA